MFYVHCFPALKWFEMRISQVLHARKTFPKKLNSPYKYKISGTSILTHFNSSESALAEQVCETNHNIALEDSRIISSGGGQGGGNPGE